MTAGLQFFLLLSSIGISTRAQFLSPFIILFWDWCSKYTMTLQVQFGDISSSAVLFLHQKALYGTRGPAIVINISRFRKPNRSSVAYVSFWSKQFRKHISLSCCTNSRCLDSIVELFYVRAYSRLPLCPWLLWVEECEPPGSPLFGCVFWC